MTHIKGKIMSKLTYLFGLSLLIALGTIEASLTSQEVGLINNTYLPRIGSDCENNSYIPVVAWENEIIRQNDDWRRPLLRNGFFNELKKYCQQAQTSSDTNSSEYRSATAFIASNVGTDCSNGDKVAKAIILWEKEIIPQNDEWRRPLLRKALFKAWKDICK